MNLLIGLVLALVAIAYVGYPLLKETDEPKTDRDGDEIKVRREELREAAAELDGERQTGKLSEEDYQALLNDISQQEAALRAPGAGGQGKGAGGRGPGAKDRGSKERTRDRRGGPGNGQGRR